ncbi:hypothetical protein [Streptomyces sp. NPDC002467]|uniref:hypothetical protein n=1 Tax=Streptomyces sp. NPDC002467 TaxID=3364647 RepID=UPI0036CD8BC1
MESGGLEVNGRGLAIACESSIVNGLSADDKARYLGSPTARLTTHELPVPDQAKVFESFAQRNSPSITARGSSSPRPRATSATTTPTGA